MELELTLHSKRDQDPSPLNAKIVNRPLVGSKRSINLAEATSYCPKLRAPLGSRLRVAGVRCEAPGPWILLLALM